VASLLLNLGRLAIFAGDHARVAACCREGLAIFQELASRAAWPTRSTTSACPRSSRMMPGAQQCFEEALALVRELGETRMVAYCLEGLAGVAVLRGELVRAGRLFGAAEADA
jgi:hypothetical protein